VCLHVADFNCSQNKVEEFFSLVHFLRIKPLNDWGVFKQRIVDPLKKGRVKAPMKRLHVRLPSHAPLMTLYAKSLSSRLF